MDYQRYSEGSARWATMEDVDQNDLFPAVITPNDAFTGYFETRPMFLRSDGPGITFGGSGSGKFTTMYAYQCFSPGHTFKIDPKGEGPAVSLEAQARLGKKAYVINHRRLHGLPHMKLNPWDHIAPDSPTLIPDAQHAARDIITLSLSKKWWEQGAMMWVEKVILAYTLKYGHVSMPEVFNQLNLIRGNPAEWVSFGAFMKTCGIPSVESVAEEIHTMAIKGEAQKETSAILGEVSQSLNFLSDPAIAETLGPNPDFSLKVLLDEEQMADVTLIMPPDDFALAPAMPRAIVGSLERYKLRSPSSPQVQVYIDECAQMGKFDTLLRLMSFGRGAGLRTWLYWQDIGQIKRIYGAGGVSTFWGNAEVRQFLGGGIRDLESAQTLSQVLGNQTLEIDDPVSQAEAYLEHRQAVKGIRMDQHLPERVLAARMAQMKSDDHKKMARAMLTVDEIVNLPPDRMINLISSRPIPPILGHKLNYFENDQLAGMYMPNPYVPPATSVVVQTRHGPQRRRIITEPVPHCFRDWPQYRDTETWSYVEGYKPIKPLR